jgi:hypothetical protein
MTPNPRFALRGWLLPAIATFGLAVNAAIAAEPQNATVQITDLGDRLRIEIGGELFTEYHYAGAAKPFLYPVIGPDGCPMTRNWPMKPGVDEAHDHPHQKSLWFTHGAVNGIDFWGEEKGAGRTVHEKFTRVKSGRDVGVIQARDQWVSSDGKAICTDDRTLRIYNRPSTERLFDFEITIHASHGPVTFGDTKEGAMGVRLAETMRLHGKVGHGHIVNSEGVRDDATWGKRAAWCDYYGPVNGTTVGVAIFDHTKNPRHPTWWHVRDYGLFAANPFGIHDFENQPKDTGNFTIPAGKSVTFRYRFYLHEGDETQGKVAEHYRTYAGQPKTE